jgi:hypothetical protein
MTVSGASAASSYAISQQAQSITQPKRGRHPSVSDVEMQGASAAGTSSPASPSGKAARKIDITA